MSNEQESPRVHSLTHVIFAWTVRGVRARFAAIDKFYIRIHICAHV